MFKKTQCWIGVAAVTSILGVSLFSRATAQITEQEFQMGRAREACSAQAGQQSLTFNRVVSTIPISNSSGQMVGSNVILNVSSSGSTYDVRCYYDNASRVATISDIPSSGEGTSGGSSSLPTEGNFLGQGLVSGSIFGNEREVDASLNFNRNNFSFSLAVPPGTGEQVQYNGTINRLRSTSSTNSNSFTLRGQVRSFASSTNNSVVITATGTCQVEVFNARVISSSCNTRLRDSATRFEGVK
ncbi:MAG TPA: hypothetical protein V6C57_04545 [Coleofasciculaceae cyanobacterium]